MKIRCTGRNGEFDLKRFVITKDGHHYGCDPKALCLHYQSRTKTKNYVASICGRPQKLVGALLSLKEMITSEAPIPEILTVGQRIKEISLAKHWAKDGSRLRYGGAAVNAEYEIIGSDPQRHVLKLFNVRAIITHSAYNASDLVNMLDVGAKTIMSYVANNPAQTEEEAGPRLTTLLGKSFIEEHVLRRVA